MADALLFTPTCTPMCELVSSFPGARKIVVYQCPLDLLHQ